MKGKVVVAVAVIATVAVFALVVPGAVRTHKAKGIIAEQLIDPSSAQFRRMTASADGGVVCGEVNGKNRLGAYTGFTRFWVNADGFARLQPQDSDLDFDKLTWLNLWAKCKPIS